MNISEKQDASTAITTVNISQQSVKHAATAGNATTASTANAVAWGNVSEKPSTYTPSSHTHDDRYYTEAEVNNLLANKIKVIWEELNYSKDSSESYAEYTPPNGYSLVSAILTGAPSGYFGVKLLKRDSNGKYTICLNWEYSGRWSTQLVLIKN